MGCDIHFFVEKYSTDKKYSGYKETSEIRDNTLEELLDVTKPRWITADKWEMDEDYYYNESFYSGGRDYNLFSLLAGVRSNSSKEVPRGIPSDISSAYRNKIGECSIAHSHSYFTLTELIESDKLFPNSFIDTIEKMKLIDDNYDNVRCVFFFDN